MMITESTYKRIYRVVARIPRGRVATYGQIAELAGLPRAARQVGYALAALRDDSRDVPWHRVINSKGEISVRSEPGFEDLQRTLLEREGVRFSTQGRVFLDRVQWIPGADATERRPLQHAVQATKKKAAQPNVAKPIVAKPVVAPNVAESKVTKPNVAKKKAAPGSKLKAG
jgi:methylated-DNA-protein-cysteine methyltransferase-like protein